MVRETMGLNRNVWASRFPETSGMNWKGEYVAGAFIRICGVCFAVDL